MHSGPSVQQKLAMVRVGLIPFARSATLPTTSIVHLQKRTFMGIGKERIPAVPEDYRPRVKDFGESFPLNPYTDLKVYCLPTMGDQLVLHPRILTSLTKGERLYKSGVFLSRRWRYTVGDFVGSLFAPLALSESPKKRRLYKSMLALITRDCEAEYFFRSIPNRTRHIEIIYPKGYIADGKEAIQEHLREISDRAATPSHKSMAPIAAMLISSLGLLTFIRHWAPVLYVPIVYMTSRLTSVIKADEGRRTFVRCIGNKAIKYTESEPLTEYLESTSREVSAQLEKDYNRPVWSLKPNSDIHDRVVKHMEKDMRLYELSRSYDRRRRDVILSGFNTFFKLR